MYVFVDFSKFLEFTYMFVYLRKPNVKQNYSLFLCKQFLTGQSVILIRMREMIIARAYGLTLALIPVHDYLYELTDKYYIFSENLNRTVTRFETQFKTSEYERLKLSSTVSSLEVAHLNLSKSKCGKFDLGIEFK